MGWGGASSLHASTMCLSLCTKHCCWRTLCLQHMSTFDKALLSSQTIFSCSGLEMRALTNELFMFICIGVCWRGKKWRSHFLRQHFSRGRKKTTKRMRGKGRTILLPIAVTVSYLQNMTLLSLSLSQPRQKHERLHKHYFMQWLDESSDSNYSLPLTPTKLYCTDSSFDTELQ